MLDFIICGVENVLFMEFNTFLQVDDLERLSQSVVGGIKSSRETISNPLELKTVIARKRAICC